MLLDLLLDWAPAAPPGRILVDNPAALYGFCRWASRLTHGTEGDLQDP